jgi:tetratricopeptide (TPR) repeat protein
MRSLTLIAVILAFIAVPASAQEEPFGSQGFELPPGFAPEEGEEAEEAPPAPPTAEELLASLAIAETEEEARDLEQRLQTLWSRSGSATVDLLFSRSRDALDEDEDEIAAELLAEVTELAPEFAEGWHQHAVISMRRENFEDAMTSLQQVLALNPKHFIAIAELGSILEEFGDNERALSAYREALALNPHIEGLDERVRDLARSVEGQGI